MSDSQSQHIAKSLVPDYIRELQVYQAGKPIDELAREKGLTRISKLASNENPLGPSPFAIREMTNGLWELHRYPDMHAYKLKTALSELYSLKRENIVLGNGSEGIMAYISRAFIRPGDEVLTSENTFIGFYILSRSVGAKLKTVPLTADYKYDVMAMAENITDKTKVIYIANPNNPTGTYITKAEFDSLMEHVPEHVLVILDEAYFEFAKDREDYPDSMDYRYDNVITLRTFSKAYGLSGIRVGYGFGNEHLISNLNKVKLPFEPNLIAQLGAVGALEDTPHLERTLKNNNELYDVTFKYLEEKGFKPIPSLTNFITIKTGTEEASNDLFNLLLEEGVIIRPLRANEMPDFVRVSIGTKDEMNHFFEAMDKILPNYDKKHGRV
ncbi:MAG: histidinol-phosphate transaminase [Deltaproteobacteria bacterium]|nr:MAG: histidinol-phosphate transaminase [Deltaproteobacteria bacterium]TNF28287.1 MAG: histidinol-phosphate transaminase [Deltaproteobacteria bacterium]